MPDARVSEQHEKHSESDHCQNADTALAAPLLATHLGVCACGIIYFFAIVCPLLKGNFLPIRAHKHYRLPLCASAALASRVLLALRVEQILHALKKFDCLLSLFDLFGGVLWSLLSRGLLNRDLLPRL